MLVSLWQENIRVLESIFSQQTVKLFEVIQEVDLVKLSKLNGLVMNKIQGMRAAVFSRKKRKRKINWSKGKMDS